MTESIDGQLKEWRDVMLRLQQMTRNDQGASIIRVKIFTVRGQPMYWFEPEKRRIEPAAGARAFCDMFDGAGTS